MKINPAKEWKELYEKLEAKLNNSEEKQKETLKNLENAKKELEQVKNQLEAQKDYEVVKVERDQLQQDVKQKEQQLQAVAKQLGLTEQATPNQIKENLGKWATDKSIAQNYLTDYRALLTQTIENLEDLKVKNSEKEAEYQSEQKDLKAQIEEVGKFISK